jgi:hypothetical protein
MAMPEIEKNILKRIEELGPFIENNNKVYRIYHMKNNFIYQGLLIV